MRERTSSALRVVLALATGPLLALTLSQHAALAHAPATPEAASPSTAVTTLRNDNGHSGQYTNETVLNQSNVNQSQFGKRVSYPVDGQLYAQPLYVPGLSIGGSTHNVEVSPNNAHGTTCESLRRNALNPTGGPSIPMGHQFSVQVTVGPISDPIPHGMALIVHTYRPDQDFVFPVQAP